MKRCGVVFHAEVGKFRFLNELIKLVSPKYLGAHTPEPVRRRVLELMHQWTIHYPKETKIREAYDMLRKQGVVKVKICETKKQTLIVIWYLFIYFFKG
jgi:ADP-ribosylation factor-binding protein GGA